VEELER
jgi:hypothetical protein